MSRLSQEEFITSWQIANSVTHASLILQRKGYIYMTPQRTLEWARCLRTFGVRLKKIPRPSLT